MAGGSGSRLGGDLPKQFRMLSGRPLLWWALKAFRDEDAACAIHLVLPEKYFTLWESLVASMPEQERIDHTVHPGGTTRTESVVSALSSIERGEDVLIAVHDAARPLVSEEIISAGWEEARLHLAAIPVVPVTDSMRVLDSDASHAVDRSRFVAVQTPQVFRGDILHNAYAEMGEGSFTDDASVVEASGVCPVLFPGSPANIKVTNPGDIEIAELLLARKLKGDG